MVNRAYEGSNTMLLYEGNSNEYEYFMVSFFNIPIEIRFSGLNKGLSRINYYKLLDIFTYDQMIKRTYLRFRGARKLTKSYSALKAAGRSIKDSEISQRSTRYIGSH